MNRTIPARPLLLPDKPAISSKLMSQIRFLSNIILESPSLRHGHHLYEEWAANLLKTMREDVEDALAKSRCLKART
jgi:hypothetical protein